MKQILTQVVNIRLDDTYDVYIGREGHGLSGIHGNPFRLNDEETRGATLKRFKGYFYKRVDSEPEYKTLLIGLKKWKLKRGSLKLGCFCADFGGLTCQDKPHICHGQIIAEYIDMVL